MFFKTGVSAGLVAAVAAIPAPQAATTASPSASASGTSWPFGFYTYNQSPSVDTAAVASVTSVAGLPASEIPGALDPVFPRVSSDVTGVTSHGPYTGTPTTTGALETVVLGSTIPMLPPNPTATYIANGLLHDPQPIPYQPAGGLGTNGTEPVYKVNSDFDYQSILLGLYQEWIELDLFNDILARFSEADFEAAGLTAVDRELVRFMAQQETGHATLLSSLLGGPGGATPQCTYNYPYETVMEAFDFSQKLTRFGESGVWGFQAHLDSREVAQLLDQSIATEARQQLIFRQFSGLFPMPVWFETGIPQSWAWTFLAPYISSCPADSKRLVWQNFPQLTVLNQPNIFRRNASQTGTNETVGFGPIAPSNSNLTQLDTCVGNNVTGFDCSSALSHNRSIPLSYPGRKVYLQWENPGKAVGPNNSYVTSTTAGTPQFAMWVSQLNITYSPLLNVTSENGVNAAMTIQPDVSTYQGDPAVNGTMFLALTDTNQTYTAFNLSMVNPHVAALAMYQAG
ncbi:putative rds1 protein [Rutstroemia sp. NJR-2017a BVV2]|nr:putative rds1 protein [Rutstroemia sp. NJR-2017a BVV2]